MKNNNRIQSIIKSLHAEKLHWRNKYDKLLLKNKEIQKVIKIEMNEIEKYLSNVEESINFLESEIKKEKKDT